MAKIAQKKKKYGRCQILPKIIKADTNKNGFFTFTVTNFQVKIILYDSLVVILNNHFFLQ